MLTAFGAVLIYMRYLQYVNHPEDANASSGMWAFGDSLLAIFIFALFLIPTFFLVRVIQHFEGAASIYSKVLLVVSITAPLSLACTYLARKIGANNFADFCLWRPLLSPFVIVVMAMSRLLARFKPAKRMGSYALLVEVGTFVVMALLIVFAR